MAERQQFNIYLPPELVRQVKYAALDGGVSLSRYVEDALRARLASELAAPGPTAPGPGPSQPEPTSRPEEER